jgi:bifunctional UDP-N-acetylglucosamine pyrophosphorylase/glucosamine-1-phosphate N-acetyltransferase
VFEGNVELGDGTIIESNNLVRDSRLGAGNVVHSNCHIEGATTGDNCEIGPFARMRPGAELANNVKIGNFVEIKKSTVADGSKVNHLTYIGDTEIGTGVNVGVAPVEVGDGATIGAGSTISRPAPPNQLTVARAKQVTVPGWKRPVKKGN